MRDEKIIIKGAREHNLKNIDLEIPRDKLIVFTGLSGSGKSSLAFDTIYAEGQRRYMESLSSYARQFLGQMEKPDVDYIEGLSPAISIDQKTVSHNPRSTVGTVTEIYDYLRLLYARIGSPFCPKCGRPISRQTVDQMVDLIETLPEGTHITVYAPVIRGRKGEYQQLIYDLYKGGFGTVRVNGEVKSLSDKIELDRYKAHTIEVLIDRLIVKQSSRSRLVDALETGLKLAKGMVIIAQKDSTDDLLLSVDLSCPYDGYSLGEISPRSFSFNSPYGACEDCHGLGVKSELSEELVIPDYKLSITEGAILPWTYSPNNFYGSYIRSVAEQFDISIDVPLKDIDKDKLHKLLYGTGKQIRIAMKYFSNGMINNHNMWFTGLMAHLEHRYTDTDSQMVRDEIEKYMLSRECIRCHGARLKEEALIVQVGGKNISQVSSLSIDHAIEFFKNLTLNAREKAIAEKVIYEISTRLEFLSKVGLDYLTLDRSATTLAGGEGQRIRLASQIGSALVGILYILDEPTIGLHPTDNVRLIETLKHLRDIGNTVIVVEHDEETMRQADYLVDIGPGAGEHGGRIIAQGTPEEVMKNPNSITAPYLTGEKTIATPKRRPIPKGHKQLIVHNASENNLKSVSASFPLGRFVVITGVSGSGKSTLITEVLTKGVQKKLGSNVVPGKHDSITGLEHIDKIIEIDQSPIGRTPRSNPVTYTKCFDIIRTLFAATPAARSRGYKPGRFSFNVAPNSGGGRCEHCQGDGTIKIEMNFLPDVYITCDVCKGSRFNKETLEVLWKGKSISQILNLTVSEAMEFFDNIPTLADKLRTLEQVGLGYVRLGQSATTLSGGEAQRIKLAAELARPATGKTLYILDEPTTGLHFADVDRLLAVLQKLIDKGNSMIVIEHNLDVIKCADWLIDLGPGGGEKGGQIIAKGTPEEVSHIKESLTGQVLDKVLYRK